MNTGRILGWLAWLSLGLAGACPGAPGTSLSEEALTRLEFDQKLNTQISLGLVFRDEAGEAVALKDYFGRQPVVLVLGYYECPMLCTLVLNGLVQGLLDVRWSIGKEFTVLNVSIDPRETPQLAAAKRNAYVKRYGRAGAAQGWHFLTGQERAIQQLAGEVGFHYAYDPAGKQYAHPSGLVILTPEGKVARYFFGVHYSPRELHSALSAASSNRVGTPIQKLILLCFHYNPLRGKYGATILFLLRCLGAVTIVALAWLIWKGSWIAGPEPRPESPAKPKETTP